MEGHNGTNMVALLSDCKLAIWVVEKIDSGKAALRSSIEARIQRALEIREGRLQETYLACVKGHMKSRAMTGIHTWTRVGRHRDTRKPESVVKKSESRGQRGERKRPTRMVPSEGPVSIYLVPVG